MKDVSCPLCGGKIVQTPFGYGCANYSKDDENSCRFSIGKIAGVKLKEAQVKERLIRKKTDVIKGFVAKTGMMFDAPLKLTEDGRVTFDFPEKPKPVESTLECPKCHKFMKKAQWNYECECGFKISHTIAKVELPEEVVRELLTTGKTAKKVQGFTSKAGNVFDTCLKYEDDQIRFDFENPGEEESGAKQEAQDDTPFYDNMTDDAMLAMAAEIAAIQEQEAAEQLAASGILEEDAGREMEEENGTGKDNEFV